MSLHKNIFKKSPEELQQYLRLMKQHKVVPSKKGKGSYKRKPKHRRSLND